MARPKKENFTVVDLGSSKLSTYGSRAEAANAIGVAGDDANLLLFAGAPMEFSVNHDPLVTIDGDTVRTATGAKRGRKPGRKAVKRGRPAGSKKVSAKSTGGSKRGRPKGSKNAVKVEGAVKGTVKAKRGPGRPPKAEVQETAAPAVVTAPKRPGRPPKSVSATKARNGSTKVKATDVEDTDTKQVSADA